MLLLLLAVFPPMRRCFPHIGGQTKTTWEPGFTRRYLQLSTSLAIEPLSRTKCTRVGRKTPYFRGARLPFPLHAIGDFNVQSSAEVSSAAGSVSVTDARLGG